MLYSHIVARIMFGDNYKVYTTSAITSFRKPPSNLDLRKTETESSVSVVYSSYDVGRENRKSVLGQILFYKQKWMLDGFYKVHTKKMLFFFIIITVVTVYLSEITDK